MIICSYNAIQINLRCFLKFCAVSVWESFIYKALVVLLRTYKPLVALVKLALLTTFKPLNTLVLLGTFKPLVALVLIGTFKHLSRVCAT